MQNDFAAHSVYWIRLEEHTDPFSQGYIGVTCHLERRWNRHCRHAEVRDVKINNMPLYVAFRKFGLGRFKFEELHKGLDKWSAYNIEYALRPHYGIGFNRGPGGFKRSALLCSSLSPLRHIAKHAEMIEKKIEDAIVRFGKARNHKPVLQGTLFL